MGPADTRTIEEVRRHAALQLNSFQIAEKLGRSHTGIRKICQRHGISLAKSGRFEAFRPDAECVDDIKRLRAQGMSKDRISNTLHIDDVRVRRIIAAYGIDAEVGYTRYPAKAKRPDKPKKPPRFDAQKREALSFNHETREYQAVARASAELRDRILALYRRERERKAA